MQVTVHAAKTNLSKLIEAAERGERVVIARNGIPAVELTPVRGRRVQVGLLKGKVAPPPADAFAPMGEEELRDWGAL